MKQHPAEPFSPIADVLDDLRQGKMVILTDDEHRENEGDLVLPAQFVSPAAITFMLTQARGYLCVAMTEEDCDRLDLAPQAAVNTSKRGTAFTVSVDYRHGTTTGISAADRAATIRGLIDPETRPADLARPDPAGRLTALDELAVAASRAVEELAEVAELDYFAQVGPGTVLGDESWEAR